ncbi:GTP cyclohydrolase II RibA [Pseudonocardia asaccharolytica]|uniref:GTP cyclohydrolase-2 n=1 Tax=Pseudonocardia asaccharolytica DSM 44247 = NBRC 16224 TaxID=1123024 RepID=A0A511D354_9PSEU|nr:GTP cyclohydrolase II RibA [Pseudonocardia asaccharolytica]GEL19211.1 GTP cyclohydrolase-2 [Pseudonocardia asaccharolytica DSM 44247 = NBRC 16224]
MNGVRELVRVGLPTQFGEFQVTAFEVPTGLVYLALAKGELVGGNAPLVRLHSECLTGDALGSVRCECGVQLRLALRRIAVEGRGLLLYATGHEGRGVGLVDKLRAYVEQDGGADTVEANLRLGLPVDGRRYDDAAAVLHALGIGPVRLLSNNPDKARGLREAGIPVEGMEPLRTAAHSRNVGYLHTKERRLGHLRPSGEELEPAPSSPPDAVHLLGEVDPPADRPYVVLKYAQTLDGRIATAGGDSQWISGEEERAVSHALRAACDAVMVGVGTVLHDDPRLTVRLVPGVSPLRVVLDSTLRTPSNALLLDGDPVTVLLTTDRSTEGDRKRVRDAGAGIVVLPAGPGGVDLVAGLRALRERGVRSLLVEGGARVITSLLADGLVDRVIVGTAPKIIGAGKEAVGDLGITRVAEGIALRNRSVHLTADDILTAWDVC